VLSFSNISSSVRSSFDTPSTDLESVRFPVRAIKKGLFGNQIRFVFNDGRKFSRTLVIHGDRKEIQFLYQHISMYETEPNRYLIV